MRCLETLRGRPAPPGGSERCGPPWFCRAVDGPGPRSRSGTLADDAEPESLGADLRVPPPSVASSIFGTSVPLSIPRPNKSRTTLSQSLLAEANQAILAQLGAEPASVRSAAAPLPPLPEQDVLLPPSSDPDEADRGAAGTGEVRTVDRYAAVAAADNSPCAPRDVAGGGRGSLWRRTSLRHERLWTTRRSCLASGQAGKCAPWRRRRSSPRPTRSGPFVVCANPFCMA